MNETYGNTEAKVAKLSSMETELQRLDKCAERSMYLATEFNQTLQMLENRPEPAPSPENYVPRGELRLTGHSPEVPQKDRMQTLHDIITFLSDNLTRLESSLGHLKGIV